jgi:luciferase family oxidoreductase group 1
LHESGRSIGDSLSAVVETAEAADRLGFTRFWLSEHHMIPVMATPSPAVMVARIAAATKRMRVGSGGVMLSNHAPLAVAESFATLDVLFPDRIDLGLGRGNGTFSEPVLEALRRRQPDSADYADDVRELLTYLSPPTSPGQPSALPDGTGTAACWLLASSPGGAQLAAELGLPLAFAHHLRPDDTIEAISTYRKAFRSSSQLVEPRVIVTAATVCAETDDEAVEYCGPGTILYADKPTAPPDPLMSVDAANQGGLSAEVRDRGLRRLRQAGAIGSPATVGAALNDLAERTGADELMLVIPVYEPSLRIRTLTLAAEACGVADR